jgi:LPXTG-motif cell wall-anchored protein
MPASKFNSLGRLSSISNRHGSSPRTPDFSSSGLQQLMSVQNFTAATNSTSGSGSGSGPGSSGSTKSSSNTGAIAGGVVGGVVGLALIAGAAVFFIRRRKNKRVTDNGNGGYPTQEMPAQARSNHEMADTSGTATPMNGRNLKYAKYASSPATAQYEMPTNEARQELA